MWKCVLSCFCSTTPAFGEVAFAGAAAFAGGAGAFAGAFAAHDNVLEHCSSILCLTRSWGWSEKLGKCNPSEIRGETNSIVTCFRWWFGCHFFRSGKRETREWPQVLKNNRFLKIKQHIGVCRQFKNEFDHEQCFRATTRPFSIALLILWLSSRDFSVLCV